MSKIKICGLKRLRDIAYVNELQPEYAGFVFAPGPRQVEKNAAAELITHLHPGIKKVGVFLNHPVEEAKEIAKDCKLDVVQFHGDEDPGYCSLFEQEVWKAFRIRGAKDLHKMDEYAVEGYLLDAYKKGQYGGTGKAFNWGLAGDLDKNKFMILAGGLHPENVREAMGEILPNVVDVSSGVESNGCKDFIKIKNFIEKVRNDG